MIMKLKNTKLVISLITDTFYETSVPNVNLIRAVGWKKKEFFRVLQTYRG